MQGSLPPPPPPKKSLRYGKLDFFNKKMLNDSEFFKLLLKIPQNIVTIISRSTHFKDLVFTFMKKNIYFAL